MTIDRTDTTHLYGTSLKGKYYDEIDVGGGVKAKYFIKERCASCQAVDKDGESIRLEIDQMLLGDSYSKVSKWLDTEHDIHIKPAALKAHLEGHSKYILEIKKRQKEFAKKVALEKALDLHRDYIDAEEVIQDIITEGGKSIKEGEMKVDTKLLLGALREQGVRKKMGTLSELLQTMDRGRFLEGETVEKKPPKELPDATEKKD